MYRRLIFCLFLFYIASCHRDKSIYSIENHSRKIDSTISKDRHLDSFLLPYRAELNRKMNDTLAFSTKELKKERIESDLGNWVADGMKWYVDSVLQVPTDIAICNYGGLRTISLPKGVIQLRHIYELMPFENQMVAITLDSNALKSFLDKIVKKDGGWPISKGALIVFSNDILDWKMSGQRKNEYKIIVSDYIANGGDNMNMLIRQKKQELQTLIRDALIAYARHQRVISSQKEGRIIKLKE